MKKGKLVVVVVDALTADLLKPNAGADVVGTVDPKAADRTEVVVLAVASNINTDEVLVLSKLAVAELVVVLDANVPHPTLVLAANVGFVAGLLKPNVSGADVVWFDCDDSVVIVSLANVFVLPNLGAHNKDTVPSLPVDCANPKEIGADFWFSAEFCWIGKTFVVVVVVVIDVGVVKEQNPLIWWIEWLDVLVVWLKLIFADVFCTGDKLKAIFRAGVGDFSPLCGANDTGKIFSGIKLLLLGVKILTDVIVLIPSDGAIKTDLFFAGLYVIKGLLDTFSRDDDDDTITFGSTFSLHSSFCSLFDELQKRNYIDWMSVLLFWWLINVKSNYHLIWSLHRPLIILVVCFGSALFVLAGLGVEFWPNSNTLHDPNVIFFEWGVTGIESRLFCVHETSSIK